MAWAVCYHPVEGFHSTELLGVPVSKMARWAKMEEAHFISYCGVWALGAMMYRSSKAQCRRVAGAGVCVLVGAMHAYQGSTPSTINTHAHQVGDGHLSSVPWMPRSYMST